MFILVGVGLLFCGCSNDKSVDIDGGLVDAVVAISDARALDGSVVRDDRPVSSLMDPELEQLCEDFHDGICPALGAGWCQPACRAICRSLGTAALMVQECVSPITVEQVRECAELTGNEDGSAFAVCSMGGGCVFDVFDLFDKACLN